MTILPPTRPKATRAEVLSRVAKAHPGAALPDVFLVAVRGYYEDSMGAPGRNDRGLYDDAMFLIGPGGLFIGFNANCDPGAVRKGQGTGAGKGMARLKPGVWSAWVLGTHKAGKPGAHRALIQRAAEVTVIRDGSPDYPDTGWFGINIHQGGHARTNSEGCLTVPPTQYGEFLGAVERAMVKAGQTVMTCVLLEGW